jgi:hypothetical protein
MNKAGLPMATLRRVRFGMERPGQIRKFEGYYRPGQPSARMRPETVVWLIHVSSPEARE